eukprot:GHRR01020829.1.p2 GENE.GHRR01020829.1~~GHRR01020829.1.p2  ORF type:complete len:710 (+),score=358.26 GHRR01020829.1:752-2881(+)
MENLEADETRVRQLFHSAGKKGISIQQRSVPLSELVHGVGSGRQIAILLVDKRKLDPWQAAADLAWNYTTGVTSATGYMGHYILLVGYKPAAAVAPKPPATASVSAAEAAESIQHPKTCEPSLIMSAAHQKDVMRLSLGETAKAGMPAAANPPSDVPVTASVTAEASTAGKPFPEDSTAIAASASGRSWEASSWGAWLGFMQQAATQCPGATLSNSSNDSSSEVIHEIASAPTVSAAEQQGTASTAAGAAAAQHPSSVMHVGAAAASSHAAAAAMVPAAVDPLAGDFWVHDPAYSHGPVRVAAKVVEAARMSFGTDEDILLIDIVQSTAATETDTEISCQAVEATGTASVAVQHEQEHCAQHDSNVGVVNPSIATVPEPKQHDGLWQWMQQHSQPGIVCLPSTVQQQQAHSAAQQHPQAAYPPQPAALQHGQEQQQQVPAAAEQGHAHQQRRQHRFQQQLQQQQQSWQAQLHWWLRRQHQEEQQDQQHYQQQVGQPAQSAEPQLQAAQLQHHQAGQHDQEQQQNQQRQQQQLQSWQAQLHWWVWRQQQQQDQQQQQANAQQQQQERQQQPPRCKQKLEQSVHTMQPASHQCSASQQPSLASMHNCEVAVHAKDYSNSNLMTKAGTVNSCSTEACSRIGSRKRAASSSGSPVPYKASLGAAAPESMCDDCERAAQHGSAIAHFNNDVASCSAASKWTTWWYPILWAGSQD